MPWPRSRPTRPPGSLPQVMPPPTWSVSRRPSATKVRIRMLVCIAPSGPIQPSAPVYGPRRTGSRPSRISMARIFGAPVIEPPGKLAASRSKASRPSASRPVTVDTRCWTAAVRSRRQSRGTRTVPGTQTRPRSLRSTSTIITFSARSLALVRSSHARSRSSLRSRPRGRVPLIGSEATRPSASTERNGSGEADRSARGRPVSWDGPRSRNAENSDGSPVRSRRYSPHGSPAYGVSSRRVRFAW